jgi:hypothetical protein
MTTSNIIATRAPDGDGIDTMMPTIRDNRCKRPEGPKYISPRCQPWVGSELSKVPEAQDIMMKENALASGMETDVLVAVCSTN